MNTSEPDRHLAAAWSAASREQPPPAVDAAIRAAARRAVNAGPGRGRRHWLYPLGAAATVAVLAVGIAQLTPPERVALTSADSSTALQPAPTAAPAPVSAAPIPPGAAAQKTDNAARAGLKKAAQEPSRRGSAGGSEQLAATGAAAPPGAAPAPARDSIASSRSEPFPAARTAEMPHREADQDEVSAAERAPASVAADPAQATSRVAAAKPAQTTAADLRQASPPDVQAWVKRIRDLRNAGRLDEAAKELAAFRTAYGKHADALLPADLRSIPR